MSEIKISLGTEDFSQQSPPKRESVEPPKAQRLTGYLVMESADCEGRTTRPSFVATSRATVEMMGHRDYQPITVYVGDVTLGDLKRWNTEDVERARKIKDLESQIARLKRGEDE